MQSITNVILRMLAVTGQIVPPSTGTRCSVMIRNWGKRSISRQISSNPLSQFVNFDSFRLLQFQIMEWFKVKPWFFNLKKLFNFVALVLFVFILTKIFVFLYKEAFSPEVGFLRREEESQMKNKLSLYWNGSE